MKRTVAAFAFTLSLVAGGAMQAGASSGVADPTPAEATVRRPGVAERALQTAAAGDVAGAIAQLRAAVAADPRDRDAARTLADLYLRAGDAAAAERTYLAILAQAPGDRETHDRLGSLYATQDRVDDAIAQFEQSLPEAVAYANLVQLHRRRGDLAEYIASLERAADDDLGSAAAQFAYGAALTADHRAHAAIEYLERADRLTGPSCPILDSLGSAYLDLKRTADARLVLRTCLGSNPSDYSALVNLGDVEIAESRLADAAQDFERAHAVAPLRPEALVDLGYVADETGRPDAAVERYLEALAADPLDRDAYVDLGYDYGQRQRFGIAEATLIKGIAVAPDDGLLRYVLGSVYASQGKTALARASYTLALGAGDPDVRDAAARELRTLR